MRVVSYEDKYRDDVRTVCVNTGPASALTDENKREYITNMFCNYYIDNEPQNCFVLVDDDDRAQGYILCSSSFSDFRKGMGKYFRIIHKTGFVNVIESFGEYLGTALFSRSAPAHMHIDINPGFTGKGYGSLLIETLFDHLRGKKVKALMLIVGEGNVEAVRFYKKHGFKEKMSAFGGCIMIKEFGDD